MSEYYDTFQKNVARVEGLNSLYIKLKEIKYSNGRENKLTDILRSEVVLLHSSFEEYFRNVLIQWLPIKANKDFLHSVPIGLKAGKKSEKIYLDDLLNYRDKKINDVIKESIDATMKITSFNSQGEIKKWCERVGIPLDNFLEMNNIDKAINRRHKIVHEADMRRDNTDSKISPIKPGDVTSWIDAYKKLAKIIENQVDNWGEEI